MGRAELEPKNIPSATELYGRRSAAVDPKGLNAPYVFKAKELIAAILSDRSCVREELLQGCRLRRIWVFLGWSFMMGRSVRTLQSMSQSVTNGLIRSGIYSGAFSPRCLSSGLANSTWWAARCQRWVPATRFDETHKEQTQKRSMRFRWMDKS